MKKSVIKRYSFFILGLLITSVAYNLFLLDNGLAAYGVSGLAIVFKELFNFDPALVILIGNVILILVSFLLLGKKATMATILGSILYPIFVKITSFVPLIIDISNAELLVVSLFGGACVGAGAGLIYRENFTTGGTDILNQILSKYLKIPMGTAILIGDGMVVLIGGITFGLEPMLYSIIVLLLVSTLTNKVLIGISDSKTFYIISDKEKEIEKYIINELNTDITILDSVGTYSNKKNKVLMTVVDNRDYYKLKSNIEFIDPKAFVTITDSYEVLNKNTTIKNKKKSMVLDNIRKSLY